MAAPPLTAPHEGGEVRTTEPPPGNPLRVRDAHALIERCKAELLKRPDDLRSARLHYEMARLYEGLLEEPKNAEKHYLEASRHSPSHVAALRGARRLAHAAGKHAATLTLFDQEIRATPDPRRRAALHYEKGRALEDGLGRRDEARKAYGQALELNRDDASVLKAIERVERRDKSWSALEKTYARLASSLTEDPHLRAALTAVRAQLAEHRADDPRQATSLYRKAVELEPTTSSALSSLKRLTRSQRMWTDLVSALQQQVSLAGDAEGRVDALWRIARVQRIALGDAASAITALEEARQLGGEKRFITQELADLYEATARHEDLAGALNRLAESATDQRERVSLSHRLGMLYDDVLDDKERARRWYEGALEMDGHYEPVRTALDALYRRIGDWPALVSLQQVIVRATEDAGVRARAHVVIGRVLESKLGQPDDAARHYSQALGLDPDDDEAFKALDRLHTAAGRYRELAELFQRRVDRTPDDDEINGFLFRIGAIYEDRLAEPKGAVNAYQRILARAPEHVAALQALARAAHRAGEHAVFVDSLEREAKLADPTRALSLEIRAAVVVDRDLGDPERALTKLRDVLGKDAKHREALRVIASTYQRLGRYDNLLETWEQELAITDKRDQPDLLHKMGEVSRTRIAKEDIAIGYFQRALAIDADHHRSFDDMVTALRSRERWADLCNALEQRIEQVDSDEARAHLAIELAELYEEKVKQPEKALVAYDSALAAMPADSTAMEARQRLLSDKKSWKDLAESLVEEAHLSGADEDSNDALLRAGGVYASRLDNLNIAADCYQKILAKSPKHIGALLALEGIYDRSNNVLGLADVYRRQAVVFEDPAAKVAALRELTRNSKDDRLLAQTYEKILEVSRTDLEALEGLAAMARARQDEAALLGLEARLASAAGDSTVRAFHQANVAELLERVGGPGALETYRAAIAADGESMSVVRGFTRVARAAGDADALREAAELEARVTGDRSLAVQLLVQAAVIRNELRDFEGAVTDLERALELDPDNTEVAARLRHLLVNLERVPYLIDVLGRAAQSAERPEAAADLHVTVAELHADHRNDLPAALAACNRALTRVATHPMTLLKRAIYLVRAQQWNDAAEALRTIIEHTTDRTMLADAHLRLAAICDDHLSDVDQAVRSLRAVLIQEDANREALTRLGRLQLGLGKRDEALELARRLTNLAEGPAERAESLVEVSRIEKALNRHEDRAKTLLEAVSLSGAGGVAADDYCKMIGQRGGATWDAYLGVLMRYKDLAARMGHPTAPTYLAIAGVFGDHLNRADRAFSTLREGVDREPMSAELPLELAARLSATGSFDRAVDALRRFLLQDVTKVDVWRALSVAIGNMGDGEESVAVLLSLMVLDAGQPEELMSLRARRARAGEAAPGLLGDQGIRQLQVNGAFDNVAAGMTGALSEALGKIYPPEYAQYGLSKRDRIRAGAVLAVRNLADRLGAVFGVPEFDLYVHEANVPDVSIELASPPAIMVPAWATSLPTAELAF
ncbi:MAG: tetratricopeptide repeat protein, partial [Deltaproteobacteria bacterium]|nr:tetratricopeptide repeat protein [Deltaproteobacteria bacterium]